MRRVTVRDLDSAKRALAEGEARGEQVLLVSPRDGVAQAGAAFFVALARELGHDVVIDASGYPGYALEALRLGARTVLFRGDPLLRRRLDRLARRQGGRVLGRLPAAASSRVASGGVRGLPRTPEDG